MKKKMKKKLFIVGVREVHISSRQIEAVDETEAVNKISQGKGEEILCEYSHTLDSDNWTVEQVKKKYNLEWEFRSMLERHLTQSD